MGFRRISSNNFSCFFILLLFVSLNAQSQNLVPNPSFEDHFALPCGFIAITPPKTGDTTNYRRDNISNYIANWYAPTSGTTDYWFFSDSTSRYINNKDCALGAELRNNQPIKAKNGSGYVGLYMVYSKPNETPIQPNYREYIQVKLQKPLKYKSYYHVSLFAQIGYNSQYCTNRLGILFSNTPVSNSQNGSQSALGQPMLYSPQILSNQYICKENQWEELSGCFQANGGEEYITVGNFFDDEHTEQRNTNIGYPGGTSVCYNLIDDVTVEEVGDAGYLPKPNFLGSDTVLCANQQLLINVPFSGGTLNWSNGDTSRNFTVNKSGVYMANIKVGQCIVSDTINVHVVPKLEVNKDTVICRGDIYTAVIDNGFDKLIWSDGSNLKSKDFSQQGVYWVKSIDHNCVQTDTLKVRVVDCPSFIPNVITPNGDGINDFFFIRNITLMPWKLTIINRWGAVVYRTDFYQNEWEASNISDGIYYYLLQEHRSGKLLKGWVEVIR